MSVEENKAIVRRLVEEGYNSTDSEAAREELLAPDFIGHSGDAITV